MPNLFIAENNASPTVHRGIEAGLDSTLWQAAPGRLSLRQAYTFSDFGYRHDARFGSNRLPGLPRRLPGRAALRSCLRPRAAERIRLAHRGGLRQQLLGR